MHSTLGRRSRLGSARRMAISPSIFFSAAVRWWCAPHASRVGLLRAISVLLFACLMTSGHAAAGTALRVGVYQNPPEVSYTDERHVEGICVEVLEHIARTEGWSLTYVPGSFQQGISRLQDGNLDLMVCLARTEERVRVIQFPTEPVIHSWSEVYASEASKIRKLVDVVSKRVAVVGGSKQQELLLKLTSEFRVVPTLVLTRDFADGIAAVTDGRADAVITNPFNGRWLAKRAGLQETAIMFGPMDIFYAGSPQLDPLILRAIDGHLRHMKNAPNSPYFQALQRWTPHDRFEVPHWLKWALGFAVVVSAISAAWALSVQSYARRLAASELAQRRHAMEVDEANRELKAFSSAVSHDLRTPLAAMNSLLTAMLRSQAENLNADGRRYLERSLQAATEMRELIEGLLSLSRVGRQPLRREIVDISELAIHVAGELQLTEPSRSTRVEVKPGMVARADLALARQVFANLISNAWKFSARARAGRIEIGCAEDEGTSWFFVRDNGVGFDAATADRLFEPFQRFHKSTEFSGTGIGLATVRRIVRRHGGAIWADSSPGEGACFHFTFEAPATRASVPTS